MKSFVSFSDSVPKKKLILPAICTLFPEEYPENGTGQKIKLSLKYFKKYGT
jgi:hypothetical protein